MMRLAALFAVLLALPVAAEQPHLELVRGLRAQGMPDLALQYLDDLAKKTPPPNLGPTAGLERARITLDLAMEEADSAKQAALIAQANQGFAAFIKASPTNPLVAAAASDQARLVALTGEVELSRARRADDKEDVKTALAAARAKFLAASKLYKEIPKKIDAQLKALKDDPGTASIRADLEQAALRAALDEGITMFKASRTYDDGARERSPLIIDAQKKFAEIADRDLNEPATWLAKAWEARVLPEIDKKKEADEIYRYLFNFGFRNPAAQPAIRLARSFLVDNAYDTVRTTTLNFTQPIGQAESWLRQFGAYRDTTEGMNVRYVLARSRHLEAKKGLQADKDGKIIGGSPIALNLLRQAERDYRGLEDSNSEFALRAAKYRMEAILARTEAQNKGAADPDITKLKNFEECFLQAQVQFARLSKTLADPKIEAKARETERLTRTTAVAQLLERAFKVVEKTDTAGDLLDGRLLQTYAYSMSGQPAKSAIVAEYAARAYPKDKKSALLAGLALDNYLAAYFDGNVPGVAVRPQESIRADLFRLESMAEWLLKTHPASPEIEKAHYTLGLAVILGKGAPEQAIAELAKVGPTYPSFLVAKIYQAQSLYKLLQPEDTDPEKVKAYRASQIAAHKALFDQTVAQLEAIAPTPADASASTLDLFVKSKNQLAQFLQFNSVQAGDLAKITPLIDAAIKVIDDNVALKEAGAAVLKSEYKAQLAATRLAAVQYAAYLESKAGHLDKAAALLEPEIKQAEAALAMPPAEGQLPPFQERLAFIRRGLLVTALRVAVKDAKIDRAREILELLQKADANSDTLQATLQQLVTSIRVQLISLRAEKKTEEAAALSKGFGDFLNQVADQKNLSLSMKLFLAQSYSGIDEHAKAVTLLEGLRDEPAAEIKGAPDSDEYKKAAAAALKSKHIIQFYLARAYREKGEFKKAEEMFHKEILGDLKPPKSGKQAKHWGYSDLNVRKEYAMLLEDSGKARDAISLWSGLAKSFGDSLPAYPPADGPEGVKRQTYFDLFFEAQRASARAWINLKKNKNVEAAKIAEGVTAAAKKLAELEASNPDINEDYKTKLRAALADYPDLKAKYVAAGGKFAEAPKE